MAKYRVSQLVMCEVKVWYEVDAIDHASALAEVAKNDTPTCVDGRDFEIISDKEITFTKVEAV
jgi:hypothetical protein